MMGDMSDTATSLLVGPEWDAIVLAVCFDAITDDTE
jgi:hypothetical protein